MKLPLLGVGLVQYLGSLNRENRPCCPIILAEEATHPTAGTNPILAPPKLRKPSDCAPCPVAGHGDLVHDPDPEFQEVNTYGLSIPMYAFVLATTSGISLPIGAALGIKAAPVEESICAAMMAFGAGALLFAVTVELYGHALHLYAEGTMSKEEMFTMLLVAILGARFYLWIERLLDAYLEGRGDKEEAAIVERRKRGPSPRTVKASVASALTDSSEDDQPSLKDRYEHPQFSGRFCHCGSQLMDDAKFCRICGKPCNMASPRRDPTPEVGQDMPDANKRTSFMDLLGKVGRPGDPQRRQDASAPPPNLSPPPSLNRRVVSETPAASGRQQPVMSNVVRETRAHSDAPCSVPAVANLKSPGGAAPGMQHIKLQGVTMAQLIRDSNNERKRKRTRHLWKRLRDSVHQMHTVSYIEVLAMQTKYHRSQSASAEGSGHGTPHSDDFERMRGRCTTSGDRFRQLAKAWADQPMLEFEEEVDEETVLRSKMLAFKLFAGLLVDGVPEGVLMGFLAAAGHLSPVLVISLFMANFPEAFSSSALLKQGRMPTSTIVAMWCGLCLLVGVLGGGSCYLLLAAYPDYGPHAHLPLFVSLGIAAVEGFAGGAMIACISSVMLPEAFEQSGGSSIEMSSGFLCTAGFLCSVALKAIGG